MSACYQLCHLSDGKTRGIVILVPASALSVSGSMGLISASAIAVAPLCGFQCGQKTLQNYLFVFNWANIVLKNVDHAWPAAIVMMWGWGSRGRAPSSSCRQTCIGNAYALDS